MYVRATPRRNKDGSVVRYLQLAHNAWDPVAKRSRAEVIYNFGREDAVEPGGARAPRGLAGALPGARGRARRRGAAGEGFDFLELAAPGRQLRPRRALAAPRDRRR